MSKHFFDDGCEIEIRSEVMNISGKIFLKKMEISGVQFTDGSDALFFVPWNHVVWIRKVEATKP